MPPKPNAKFHRVGSTDAEAIIARFDAGESPKQIAANLPWGAGAISALLHRNGRDPSVWQQNPTYLQDRVVALYAQGLSYAAIFSKTGVTRLGTIGALTRRGLPLRNHSLKKLSPEQIVEATALYESGLSLRQVAPLVGASWVCVKDTLRAHGVPMRDKRMPRKYGCDDTFFDVLDSDEKAYWLGFIAADGSVDRRGRVCLGLTEADKDHVQHFLSAIRSDAPIHLVPSQVAGGYVCAPSVRVNVTSPHMVSSLDQYGVRPRKTYSLRWPAIPAHLEPAFLRGVFDGDGHVVAGGVSFGITGYRPFLRDCRDYLSRTLGFSAVKIEVPKHARWHGALRYGGRHQLKSFYELIYAGAAVWLPRKRERIEAILASFGGSIRGRRPRQWQRTIPLPL